MGDHVDNSSPSHKEEEAGPMDTDHTDLSTSANTHDDKSGSESLSTTKEGQEQHPTGTHTSSSDYDESLMDQGHDEPHTNEPGQNEPRQVEPQYSEVANGNQCSKGQPEPRSPSSDEDNKPPKKMNKQSESHPACQFRADKPWLDRQYHQNQSIKKPNELEEEMADPPGDVDNVILDRIQGSMIGMALGDALGAHVEFRPREYLRQHPVTKLESGGTWGLEKGQFTDDTSMALCLANSLVARRSYVPYDQLVRYKWWYRDGYMSSTGRCFDIGAATSQSLREFERRQQQFAKVYGIPLEQLDFLSDVSYLHGFNVFCSEDGVAGNGALMRLTPVPLFFYKHPNYAVEFSGLSGVITHGDRKAYDACRYYGALIVAALNGTPKADLLDKNFFSQHETWFNHEPLHEDIMKIAQGSYQREGGYNQGIRGKGYIVPALEAALWAFWSDGGSFETGALAAVNLGDDTDTTAAIYGQLAGACYGFNKLPQEWLKHVYAKKFIKTLSKWIAYEGQMWRPENSFISITSRPILEPPSNPVIKPPSPQEPNADVDSEETKAVNDPSTERRLSDVVLVEKESHEPQAHAHSEISTTAILDVQREPTTTAAQDGHIANTEGPRCSDGAPVASSSEIDTNNPFRTTSESAQSQDSSSLTRSLNLDKSWKWSCDDVCHWIQSLGEDYATYVDAFRKKHVDAYCLLVYVNNDVLIRYGVIDESHRRVILAGIEQFKKDSRRRSGRSGL